MKHYQIPFLSNQHIPTDQLNSQGPLNNSTQQILNGTLIKCEKGNPVVLFCINQKCYQKFPFTCIDYKCKCNLLHNRCKTGKIGTVLDMIAQKFSDTQKLKQNIDQMIDMQITRLSDLRDVFFNLIDQKQKFINLTQIQTQFYKIFSNQQNYTSLSGQRLAQLWDIINNDKINNTNVFEETKQLLGKFSDTIQANIQILMANAYQIIEANNVSRITNLHQLCVQKSSIINSTQRYSTLINFFPKKVSNLKLLFKASEHKFNLAKYYELCGHETNTIIICLNDKGKILGGFTPLHFGLTKPTDIGFAYDNQYLSFVFSLTSNEKFPLRIPHPAITRFYRNDYISFGNGFLLIGNNANSPNNVFTSSLYFNNLNYDRLHYRDNRQSYLKVIGNETYAFKVKEWEVIKVHFQQ